MYLIQRSVVGRTVLFNRSTKCGFGVSLHPFAPFVPPFQSCLGCNRQVLRVTQVLILREVAETAVNGAPQLCTVIAAPVEDGSDVDHAIAAIQMRLNTAGQRDTRIRQQLIVLLFGVNAPVAAGHDPQHIVIVEGDVPLNISRPIL